MDFSKLKRFYSPSFLKKGISWIITALIILILIFVVRSCMHHGLPHKQYYLIGRDSGWYPLQLYGKERNLQAFTNDLFAAISKDTGILFGWVETGPSSLVEGLNSGAYDAILSSMRPNVVNQDIYVFSELIYEIGPVLVVRKDSKVESLKDMENRTIGVLSGSPLAFNAIRARGANAYNLILVTYPNADKAFEALLNNQIDGVILDAPAAYTFIEGYYIKELKVVTPPMTDEGLRLIARKVDDSTVFMNIFNEALKKLKENGTYDSLIDKWNLINPETRYKKLEAQQ